MELSLEHGFLKMTTTVTNLIDKYCFIHVPNILDQQAQINVIYPYFSKAFDN